MEPATHSSPFIVRIGSETLSIVPVITNPVVCTNPRCQYTYGAAYQDATGLCPICRP